MHSYLTGFATSLSLILPIGAQNSFVLRQGLMRRHVLAVCIFCAMSDAVLIAAGVMGWGVVGAQVPIMMTIMRWAGAAFLLLYGARAFWAAWRGSSVPGVGGGGQGLGATLATLAALTWLNPHVWLDTVVLLGAVAAGIAPEGPGRWAFLGGAITASTAFFFALGFGARLLAPLFMRPASWRVLDALVGCVMWAIAWSLVRGM